MHRRAQCGSRGVSAIEVVIGVTIAALVLVFASDTIGRFMHASRTASERTKALYLAEEGLELVRFLRDGGWSAVGSLTVGTTYYLAGSGASLAITTTPTVVDGYTRSFTVANAYRNGSQDIVASTTGGASADAETRYISMNVSWGSPASSVALVGLLTNIDP